MSERGNVAATEPAEIPAYANPAERRRDLRISQLFRTVHFTFGDAPFEFRLRTLSLRGASGIAAEPLEKGQTGTVLFEGGRSVPASVRWTREQLAGLYFSLPLPLDLLHVGRHDQKGGTTPRARRYSVARPATLICAGDKRLAVEIRNISEGGMLIFGRPILLPGQVVEIVCGAAPLLRCQVRWVRNGFAGLQFAAPISLAEFDDQSRA
ncbi:PilZ domain-containing protein [Sphingomonas sp. HITSZ_GF]|uniref:PilZ domain-containing protein n=1 Tax=Sphingomonas sp. HITSZ_GF TaxID=3037247 RepID=UPI00240D13C1|nr:PilZ domain-containing protein [Sphingomonas sp. HITSZ_GF]MDG2535910.1 PilZ domain-containing protein [Sphingomonas sp. HITSZ_GF]